MRTPFQGWMAFLGGLALFSQFFSFSGFASDPPPSAKPRHVVFLVHGLAADPTIFGSLEQALRKTLPTLNSAFEYEVTSFEYDTGNDKKNTYMFAEELGNAIDNHFTGRPIDKNDKISLVMHSQGGVVGMIWLSRASSGDAAFHPKYTKHVDAFLTLATPFWGAKIALFASSVKNIADHYHVPFPLKMGQQELQDLAMGSAATLKFRQKTIDDDFHSVLESIRATIRPLQITGIVSYLKPLRDLVTGEDEFEDDTAVSVPCARFDYLFTRAEKPGYADGEITSYDSFCQTGHSKLTVIDALHITPVENNPDVPAIATVFKDCIDNPKCDHPAYRHILKHLAGQPVDEEGYLGKMTAFVVDIGVRLDPKTELDPKDVKIQVLPSNDPLSQGLNVVRPFEFYSNGALSNNSSNGKFLRFWMTGTSSGAFIPKEKRTSPVEFADRKLNLKISSPGFKSRIIEAKVRSTYTTYIELNLEPVTPPIIKSRGADTASTQARSPRHK